jgi:L-serine kinase (ATP) / ParB family transcriptional regulator, heme-responsive regulator
VIPSLNDLRLVGVQDLILHEAHDKDRLLRLRARMEEEKEQRNPVIISSQGDCCLVLDGAHRVRALQELGSSLALVQVVEPPEKAESWAHLLDAFDPARLQEIEEVEVSDRPVERPLAEVETSGVERVFLRSRKRGLSAEVRALWALQALYPEGVVVRRVDPDGPVKLAEGEAMIRYRPFTPGELVEVVRSGTVLPAGITRFRVQERVLNVRYPLEKMRNGDAPTRNAELRTFVQELWNENRIRYYQEPVVLFE